MAQNGEYMFKKSGYMPDFSGMAFFCGFRSAAGTPIGLKCLKNPQIYIPQIQQPLSPIAAGPQTNSWKNNSFTRELENSGFSKKVRFDW